MLCTGPVLMNNSKQYNHLKKQRPVKHVIQTLLSIPYSKKYIFSWVRWLKPVIPALWEAKVSRSLEVRSSRPPWPIWVNPVY